MFAETLRVILILSVVLFTLLPIAAKADAGQKQPTRLDHDQKPASIARIALYPLSYSQYSQYHDNGQEMAQLLTSLLMIELSKGILYELVDRSHVDTLFAEKALMKANGLGSIEKLPLSDLTLVGSLFASEQDRSFSLRLVNNRTGEILGAPRFNFTLDTIEEVIKQSVIFIDPLVENVRSKVIPEKQQKIAFGHFIDISENESALNQGRDITQRLISAFVDKNDYSVLTRTQIFPLVFEQYLRLVQYSDEYQDAVRQNLNTLVYGKYRVNGANSKHRLSLYLYIDNIKAGRDLVVLHARNWNEAYQVIYDAILKHMKPNNKVNANDNAGSQKLLAKVSTNPKPANPIRDFMGSRRDSSIERSDFNRMGGTKQASKIYQLLLEQQYLVSYGESLIFNIDKKSDQVFNRPYALSLGDLDPDVTIQVFEKLRQTYFKPGSQINISKSRSQRSSYATTKAMYTQFVDHKRHNIEALIHFAIARTASNMSIYKTKALPEVEFNSVAHQETESRRLSNLEIAVDGFAASVYLDHHYLKAMVLLGHSLCQLQIGRCDAGKLIHSWVVDQTIAEKLEGRAGAAFSDRRKVDAMERMIFLAADAVDRVDEAKLSRTFSLTYSLDKYLIKKSQQKLKDLLTSSAGPIPKADLAKAIFGYEALIREYCRRGIKIRKPEEYVNEVEEFITLAQHSEEAALLIKSLLEGIAADYPEVYPYLIGNAQGQAPFLTKAQDEMVSKVVAGKMVPARISRFMIVALNLFEARVSAGDIDAAKLYIQYFIDHYGLTPDTALDFAYLYQRVGEMAKSVEILKGHGRTSFSIRDFTVERFNGHYETKAFDNGRLIFINKEKQDHYFVYQVTTKDQLKPGAFVYDLGEKPIKWSMYFKGIKSKHHSISQGGNLNDEHPDLFSFGNGARINGKRTWTSPARIKVAIPPEKSTEQGVNTEHYTQVEALDDSALNLAENQLERLFRKNFRHYMPAFDASAGVAVSGFRFETSAGPVLDEYFYNSFRQKRKLSVVKEQLFEKGFLSVTGKPLFGSVSSLKQSVIKHFPHYNDAERRSLIAALVAAKKIKQAGAAKVYQQEGHAWRLVATLTPTDAITERHFGKVVAIDTNRALICDGMGGVYSFTRIKDKWIQQQWFESQCKKIAINQNWAIIGQSEAVDVYHNENGIWHKVQTLKAGDYLIKKNKNQTFDYFGDSLAITEDTIVIGNPHGGPKRYGEVYLFSQINNQWQQTKLLQPFNSTSNFGISITAIENYIAIGDTMSGAFDSPDRGKGRVLVYGKDKTGWQFKALLVAKDRQRYTKFGGQLLLTGDKNPSLLINSNNAVFRYVLPW